MTTNLSQASIIDSLMDFNSSSFDANSSFIDYDNSLMDANNSFNDFNNSRDSMRNGSDISEGYEYPFYIFDIIAPLITVVGVVGNLLCLLVLRREALSRLSASVYMTALTVADTGTLLVSETFFRVLEKAICADCLYLYYRESWACKVVAFVIGTFPQVSSWLIVAISMERLVVVLMPLRAKTLCTPRAAKIVTVCLYVVFMLMNVPNLFLFEVISDICNTSNQAYYVVNGVMSTIFYSILPSALILVANIIIISVLTVMARRRQNLTVSSQQNNTSLNVMLVALSVSFLILTVPRNVLANAVNYFNLEPTLRLYFLDYCLYQMQVLNSGVNFFLYFICGSLFRRELLLMFRCKRAKRKPSLVRKTFVTDTGQSMNKSESERTRY